MTTTETGILAGNTRPTRPQIIEALREAGMAEPGRVEVHGGGFLAEVELMQEGDQEAFHVRVAPWGGFRTGSGSWVLRPSYKSQGEWSDPTSAWHR